MCKILNGLDIRKTGYVNERNVRRYEPDCHYSGIELMYRLNFRANVGNLQAIKALGVFLATFCPSPLKFCTVLGKPQATFFEQFFYFP